MPGHTLCDKRIVLQPGRLQTALQTALQIVEGHDTHVLWGLHQIIYETATHAGCVHTFVISSASTCHFLLLLGPVCLSGWYARIAFLRQSLPLSALKPEKSVTLWQSQTIEQTTNKCVSTSLLPHWIFLQSLPMCAMESYAEAVTSEVAAVLVNQQFVSMNNPARTCLFKNNRACLAD